MKKDEVRPPETFSDEEAHAITGVAKASQRALLSAGAAHPVTAGRAGRGSVRRWDRYGLCELGLAWALHGTLNQGYRAVAPVVKSLHDLGLLRRIVPTGEEWGRRYDLKRNALIPMGSKPTDWFLEISGRGCIFIRGAGAGRLGLDQGSDPKPAVLIGELMEDGEFLDLTKPSQEPMLPEILKAAESLIDRTFMAPDYDTSRYIDSYAMTRLNLSAVWRACALRAAGHQNVELA